MHVLICGGGVIGVSIAYFLGCRGVKSTVIESTGLACAASGKSGGFLARAWCDGTPLAPLARRSFALHAELNEKLGGNWGYRRLDTYGGFAGFSAPRSAYRLGWLSSEVKIGRALGSRDDTAQVHPGQFTTAMMRAAAARGAELLLGRVTAITKQNGRATGVIVAGEMIEGDAVVVAMGPWSILAASSLPIPAVFGLKGHSLVFDTGDAVPGEALFIEYREQTGTVLTPEVFPRADGTTYVCAISSETPLPVDPGGVAPDHGAIERLEAVCAALSPVLSPAKILVRQACYRPTTADGLPLIGRVPGVAGAYVATGHSVWGILNAPATGEAVAELIVDRSAHTVDLRPFDPRRLPPGEPAAAQKAPKTGVAIEHFARAGLSRDPYLE
jgi:glycine/D-amino acid oxidase-like deaminating enzyme